MEVLQRTMLIGQHQLIDRDFGRQDTGAHGMRGKRATIEVPRIAFDSFDGETDADARRGGHRRQRPGSGQQDDRMGRPTGRS
jgi:hypothetical protein